MNVLRGHLALLSLLATIFCSATPLCAQPFECTGTDAWLPAGAGNPGDSTFAEATDGNLLYLFGGHYRIDGALSVWDGSSVRTIASTGTADIAFPMMEVYRGKVYLAGSASDIAGVAGTRGLARWNGSAWESPGVVWDYVSEMAVFRDQLYAADGTGTDIIGSDGTTFGIIARYDGSSWKRLDTLRGDAYGVGVTAMTVFNNELIISGRFTSVNGVPAVNFARFDGTTWKAMPAVEPDLWTYVMVQFRDRLYMVDDWTGRILEWDGDSRIRAISDPAEIPVSSYRHSLAVHNDRLYTFGYLIAAGTPLVRRNCAAYDGTRWHPVSSIRGYGSIIDYKGTLMAHGRLLSSCGTLLNNLAFYCDNGSCAQISGSIYRDADADCQADTGEPGVAGRIVEVTPGPIYTTTTASGSYTQFVLPGTYSVAPSPYLHWTIDCPASLPASVTLARAGEKIGGNDFAVSPIPGIQDLRVSVAAGTVRAGRETDFILHYINVGTEPAAGTARFTFDSRVLAFTRSTLPPGSRTDGMVEWATPMLQPGEEGKIVVTMTASTGVRVGDVICVSADCIIGDLRDELPLDNHDEVCTTVLASYDPNDLTVSPTRLDIDYLWPEDTVLSYQVRFQNTGNDTAFRVVLRDTLDAALDIRTLAFGAAGHDYTWRLEGRNVLVMTFDNILLPDSGANERESHGIIKYRLHLKHGIAPGTEIRNRVGIYFDYNAVVMTNEVVSRTQESSSTPADLLAKPIIRSYPRPARDLLHIDARLVPGSMMSLRSIDGRTFLTASATGSGREQIDVAGLPAGIYMLEMASPQGRIGERVIITP